jgi:Carbohydrate-selective porin
MSKLRRKRPTRAHTEGISSNPGAVDVRTGTGELQETIEGLLGLPKDTGFFLGGLLAADANWLATGGNDPGKWSFNRLLILGAGVDAQKVFGWPGGRFGVQFLQFNGENTNRQAGSVQGYNSLPGPDHCTVRSSTSFGGGRSCSIGKFILRFGKVADKDFNNVLRPVPVQDQHLHPGGFRIAVYAGLR